MRSKLAISSVNEWKLRSLSKRQQEQLKDILIDRLLKHRQGINHYKGGNSIKRLKNLTDYYTLLSYINNKNLSEYYEDVLWNETNFVLDRLVDVVNEHGSVNLALDLPLIISSFDGTRYCIAYGIGLDLATEIKLFLDSLSIGFISRTVRRAKSRRERVHNIITDLNVALSDSQCVQTD